MSTNNGLVVHQLKPVSDTLNRERSHSASDFERLSIMDTTTDIVRDQERDSNSISPPLPVMKERSVSLTPQPMRKIPHYATLRRSRLTKGKTIDTSNITREDHEDYSLLNQYKVSDIIGHGAFGIVHKATSCDDTETYALKIVGKRKLIKKGFALRRPKGRPNPAHDPLAEIKKEIAILKKLDHPNVVKLVEVLDDPNEDDMVLVFEYIAKGAVMSEITPENRISEHRSRKYFIDLLLGLEYLHSQKIVHRDIKPENLLLDDYDHLKIADFGVSEQWSNDCSDAQLRKSAGTRAFAAPETLDSSCLVFSGTPLDIWAAGVTLYCFVFGKVPFSGQDIIDLFDKILTKDVYYPDNIQVSPKLKDLINKLLEKDPDNRITIDEMRLHPWITEYEDAIPSSDVNCSGAIDVSEKEIENAVQNYSTPIHILVMIRGMAKQKSLRNPYTVSSVENSPIQIRRSSTSFERRNNFAQTKTIPAISVSEDSQ